MNVDESDNLGRDQFASRITVKFEAAKKRARLEAEAQKSWLAVVGYNRVRSETLITVAFLPLKPHPGGLSRREGKFTHPP
jgi:hypothetical protein